MSSTKFFSVDSDVIPIDNTAARIATEFFVEKAWVRSNESFLLHEVLERLVLNQ